jgi:hypothetical protein
VIRVGVLAVVDLSADLAELFEGGTLAFETGGCLGVENLLGKGF